MVQVAASCGIPGWELMPQHLIALSMVPRRYWLEEYPAPRISPHEVFDIV